MRKMVNPKGVKVNMCCASCKYLKTKLENTGYYSECSKKNMPTSSGEYCEGYIMDEFFQKRGYKPL